MFKDKTKNAASFMSHPYLSLIIHNILTQKNEMKRDFQFYLAFLYSRNHKNSLTQIMQRLLKGESNSS